MSKNLFLSMVAAYLKGDNAEIQALTIQKNALAATRLELANLNTQELEAESAIEDAQENWNVALMNDGKHKDFKASTYMQNMVRAENVLKVCEKTLENIKYQKEFVLRIQKALSDKE